MANAKNFTEPLGYTNNMPKKVLSYKNIFIIYNPKSTGDSVAMADALARKLKGNAGLTIKLLGTQYAAHAEKLAYDTAKQFGNPLLVSSSGDGGYHEVINGALRAQNEGAKPVCAVIPAGNANDHSRTMQDEPLHKNILKGKVTSLDVLEVIIETNGGKKTVRYGHSYAGLGITAVVAAELNKERLDFIKEKWIVLKKLVAYRPVTIVHGGRILKYDSLVFGNINQMAKLLTLSKDNKPQDGKFEVVAFPYNNKVGLLKKLIKSVAVGLDPSRTANYSFRTEKKLVMQIDGEVLEIPAGSSVTVSSRRRLLQTVV